jgi:hypothetical protein
MTTKPCFVALALIAFSGSSWAQITLSGGGTPDEIIPNNDSSGIAETITLPSGIQSITDVQLTLNIGGTPDLTPFNGNYFAYLTDGSTTVTLLNRVGTAPGSTVTDMFGYSDMGFDITLADGNPDIHTYQTDPYTLSGGQLTGTWGPDGDALSAFDGQGSAGTWTLFIADESEGGGGNLDSWSLDVTGFPGAIPPGVPDDSSTMELLFVGVGLLALYSIRQRRKVASR